jgi:hypothetical protein
MTPGHKHRYVTIRQGGLLYRVLRKPFLETTNRTWVERSKMVFGVVDKTEHEHEHYTLSLLGILHGLTGLTLYWPAPPPPGATEKNPYDQGGV